MSEETHERSGATKLALAAVDGAAIPGRRTPHKGRPRMPASALAASAPAPVVSDEPTIDDFGLRLFLQVEKDLTETTIHTVALGASRADVDIIKELEERRKALVGVAAHLHPKTLEQVKSKARMAAQCPRIFGSLMADLLDQR